VRGVYYRVFEKYITPDLTSPFLCATYLVRFISFSRYGGTIVSFLVLVQL